MKSLPVRIIISVLAITALIVHLTKWREIQFSWEALVLIAIALLPWLSEFIESFKFGKDSFELKLREIEKKANAAIDASLRGVAKNPGVARSHEEIAESRADADPQKGKWGGKPAVNGRVLSARIEKIPNESFFRRVIVRVESTDLSRPLTGKVVFHLHPTFTTPTFEEPVIDGVAETSLISYGVFTVGAETDNGETQLELDLVSLNDKKDQFFQR